MWNKTYCEKPCSASILEFAGYARKAIWAEAYFRSKFKFEYDNKSYPFDNYNSHYALKMRGGKLTIRFCTTKECKNLQELFTWSEFDKLPSDRFKSYDEIKNIINPNFPEIAKLLENKKGERWEWWPILEDNYTLNFIMLLDTSEDIEKIVEEIKEFIEATYVPFSNYLVNPNTTTPPTRRQTAEG